MTIPEALAINAPGSLVDTAELRALVEENARLKGLLRQIEFIAKPWRRGGSWDAVRTIAGYAVTKGG